MHLRVTPAKGAESLSILVSHLLRAAPWNINSSEVLAFSGRHGVGCSGQRKSCSVASGRLHVGAMGTLDCVWGLWAGPWPQLWDFFPPCLRPGGANSSPVSREGGAETPSWKINSPHCLKPPYLQHPRTREGRSSTFEWCCEFLLLPELSVLMLEMNTLGTKSDQRMICSLIITRKVMGPSLDFTE